MKRTLAHSIIFFLYMGICFPAYAGDPSAAHAADSMEMARKLEEARNRFYAGDMENAMKLAHEAGNGAASLGYVRLQALSAFRMGLVFLRMENPERAIENLNRACMCFQTLRSEEDVIYCLANTAIAYGMARDYDSSISRFEELARIYRRRNDTLNYAKTLINISHACSLDGNQEKALEKLETASIFPCSKTVLAKDFHLMKGVVLKKLERYAEAEKQFDTADRIAREENDYETMAGAAQGKAEILERNARYKESMEEYKRLHILSDSLNRIKHNKEVYEIENRYRLAKKDQDLALMNREKKISEQRAVILISLLTAIIFAVALFALRIKTKHYKSMVYNARLKEKIDNNSKILSGLGIQGHEATQLLKRLRENMADLKKNDTADHHENWFAVNRTLDQLWQLLETRELSLDDKNNEFILRLENRYPHLSPVEKKTCMLLYIDLSTKEIAESFHISEKSVNNTRSRIRKKLNVPNEVSLTDFLKKFMA